MQTYFPKVIQVVPMENFHVQVYFDDGKIVDYDTTTDLDGEVFRPLKDIQKFMNTCTVINNTLAWDLGGNLDAEKCVDIDPFTLHELPSINHQLA